MKIKNFFKRHSFLIVLLIAILVAGTNYLVYPTFIKRDLNLVEVPVANKPITEATKVDETMLSTVAIAIDYIPANIVTDKEQIINMYVQRGNTIPTNGFFYNEQLTSEEVLFGSTYAGLAEGKVAYNLVYEAKDNIHDSFKKGMYISIYYVQEYEETSTTKHKLFGQIGENIKIIDVDTESQTLVLEVDEKDVSYLKLAESYGELIPSLNSYSNSPEGSNYVYTIEDLKVYLESKSRIYFSDYEEPYDYVEVPAEENTEA